MEKIYLIVFFIFGAIISSFLCVIGFRLPQKIGFVKGSSRCDNCHHKLYFYEKIPILSYIIQSGNCRYCKNKISIIIPVCEILGATLFSMAFYRFGFSYNLIVALLIASLFIIVLVTDTRYFIIPDSILIIFSILLIIVQFFNVGPKQLLIHILTGIGLFLVMYLIMIFGEKIFKKESLGGADVKLLFLFGLVLDPMMGIVTIFLASIVALPVSLIVLVKNKTNMIPFGPFLISALIFLFYSSITMNQIIHFLV